MINFETGIYIGIVVIGAMIVLVTAFLIVKSTSKNSTAQTRPSEDIEVEAAMKKRYVPHSGRIDDRMALALWKIKRDILKGIRALRKRSTPPDLQLVDEGPTLREQQLTPLPDNTGLGLQTNTLPSPTDQEISNIELVNEEETEANMTSTSTEELGQGLLNVEATNEEEDEVNIIDKLPPELAESTQEQPQEELEHDENESLEEYKTPDNEHQEQAKANDDMLNLFKGEMAGDSDISTLASNLNNVDVHDLLEEARRLLNQLSGRANA